jgi:hypothetical protein
MTEIETVIGKTGSKQVVVETNVHHRPIHNGNRVVKYFRDRLTPGVDRDEARAEVVPPYHCRKENTLFNNIMYRETANPVVDMTADATEI